MARKIYHMVGLPTLWNLKMIIRENIIKNCPVTVEGIDISENIFDPYVFTFEGRTARQGTKVVVDYFI